MHFSINRAPIKELNDPFTEEKDAKRPADVGEEAAKKATANVVEEKKL